MNDPIALRRLVGENIRSLRKARGWSQEELGEHADLSYKFVGEVERGAVNPSIDSLVGIANALNVEMVELFQREDLVVLSDNDVANAREALSALNRVFERAKSMR